MNENQTRILIIVGSLVAVLLLVLVLLLLSNGDGDAVSADTSTTSEVTTTSEAATTTVAPTTTEAPTTTVAVTTTAAPATTAATTTTTTTTLPPDYALAFDGTDDFVSVFDTGDFDFGGGSGMVVEAWVKPTALTSTGSYAGILRGAASEPPGGGGAWVLFLDNDDHSDWGLSGCVPSCNSVSSGVGGLTVGGWQHVAAMYDGTTLQIYRNGQFLDSTPLAGSLSNVNYLLMGIWTDSFHGLIDEVRVWNTPRSPNQILTDFNRVLDGTEVGLVGYWRFNEGAGQVAGDSSGQGNDGKLGSVVGVDVNDPIWTPSDVPVG